MIPVLAVSDPQAACHQLVHQLGFRDRGQGRMAFGKAQIMVVPAHDRPDDLLALALDHVAFRIADADVTCQRFLANGARLDPHFTPDGPRDIAAFWGQGVRYVFFAGPEGAAFEFCARNDPAAEKSDGHSHFGVRTAAMGTCETDLEAYGFSCVAAHVLPGDPRPTKVRFLQSGEDIFELFDEPANRQTPVTSGWVGLLP